MPLDARLEAQKLLELYKNDPTQQSFNLLLLGEKGSGKTNLLRTARKPVYIDSFDPEGTLTLRDEIVKGNIVVNTEWEKEDRLDPDKYLKWKSSFDMKLMNGASFFKDFGTYCIDSSTTWSMAIMNAILKKAGIQGEPPRFTHDYRPQRNEIDNQLWKCLRLPCDFILTGHLMAEYETKKGILGDEYRDIVNYKFLTTGQGVVLIPTLFAEMWVLTKEARGSGVVYKLLTNDKGLYKASTRIGAGGKLEREEEPNIKDMLKKCGFPHEDKPPLFSKEKK